MTGDFTTREEIRNVYQRGHGVMSSLFIIATSWASQLANTDAWLFKPRRHNQVTPSLKLAVERG